MSSTTSSSGATASGRLAKVGRHSVDRFRDMVLSGAFASAAVVDRQTGEVVDPEARALFAALPAVTPATSPDELLDNGLITKLPRALHRAFDQPKYRVGRELFVRTTVNHRAPGNAGVGLFDPASVVAFTHRATLTGQRGDELLVSVEGSAEEQAFARTELFTWNEPSGVPAAGGKVSGVQVDYNAPLFKAHICAGYVSNAEEIGALDFEEDESTTRSQQVKLLHNLASRIRMSYAGRTESYAGHRAGALLNGGQGVCFVQRAVAGTYLQAFARIIGFEVQLAIGRTLSLGTPHGFAVILLRPSLYRFVVDPAWSEPLTDLRVAFFDNAWGHDRCLEGFEGKQEMTIRPVDVDLPETES